MNIDKYEIDPSEGMTIREGSDTYARVFDDDKLAGILSNKFRTNLGVCEFAHFDLNDEDMPGIYVPDDCGPIVPVALHALFHTGYSFSVGIETQDDEPHLIVWFASEDEAVSATMEMISAYREYAGQL